MIKYKSNTSQDPFEISKGFNPRPRNFYHGTFFINDKEYTKWNKEFEKEVEKEKLWQTLQQ
jgi:hypothetical protein